MPARQRKRGLRVVCEAGDRRTSRSGRCGRSRTALPSGRGAHPCGRSTQAVVARLNLTASTCAPVLTGLVGGSGYMALVARERRVLAGEELRLTFVREGRHLERRRGVARLAGGAELGLMHVGVAARAGGLQAAEVRGPCGGGTCRERDRRVTFLAGQAQMLARELEAGRGMVERRLAEARLRVAGLAVLLERAPVDVDVAGRAGGGLGLDLHRRLLVAGGAVGRGVAADERERRARVVDAARPPRVVRVAGRTGRSELLHVRIAMAVVQEANLRPLNVLFTWQLAQATVLCAPSS